MNGSSTPIVIPVHTQIEGIEIALAQLNEVKNIAEESSCQGRTFSPKINKENLTNLLKENEDISGKKITEAGRNTVVEHYINAGDTKQIHQKPYGLSQPEREILD